jgi:hypothetical protein
MFKNVISPIQMWLLEQGRCVGCGMPLSQAKSEKHKEGNKITCKCNRIYIQDPKGEYRRALIEEV